MSLHKLKFDGVLIEFAENRFRNVPSASRIMATDRIKCTNLINKMIGAKTSLSWDLKCAIVQQWNLSQLFSSLSRIVIKQIENYVLMHLSACVVRDVTLKPFYDNYFVNTNKWINKIASATLFQHSRYG